MALYICSVVVLGFGSQAFVCGFSRQNINSVILGVSYKNTHNRIFYDKIVVKKSKTYGTARRARRAVKLNDNNRCKKRNFQQKKVLVSYFRSDPDICPLHPLISPPSYMVELVRLWSFNHSKKVCKAPAA